MLENHELSWGDMLSFIHANIFLELTREAQHMFRENFLPAAFCTRSTDAGMSFFEIPVKNRALDWEALYSQMRAHIPICDGFAYPSYMVLGKGEEQASAIKTFLGEERPLSEHPSCRKGVVASIALPTSRFVYMAYFNEDGKIGEWKQILAKTFDMEFPPFFDHNSREEQ